MHDNIIQKPGREWLEGQRPVFQSLCILTSTIVIVQRLLDFAFMPPLQGTTGKMYLFVRPFHKLVSVVGAWTMISNELIPYLAGILVQSHFLFELRLNGPQSYLHAPDAVQHVVHTWETGTNLRAPVKANRNSLTTGDTFIAGDLVLVKVHMLEDVDVGMIFIRRKIRRHDDKLHAIWNFGFRFETEGFGKSGVFGLDSILV